MISTCSIGKQLCRAALDAKFCAEHAMICFDYAMICFDHAMICFEAAQLGDGYLVMQVGAVVEVGTPCMLYT